MDAASPCYADEARFVTARVASVERLARDTFRLRMDAVPIAERIRPGQFVMVRLHGQNDVILGRPLALYETHAGTASHHAMLDVVFVTKGRFTTRAAMLTPGCLVEVWGPLGNGFPALDVDHLMLVAGGIGQTPFVAVTREALGNKVYGGSPRGARARRVSLIYGARSAAFFAGLEDFRAAGAALHLATDDGSLGFRGTAVDLLRHLLAEGERPDHLFCCGPEKMMEAAAQAARMAGIPCHVSLETPMACGIGICFTCVAKVKWGEDWDYRRTCVEGPIFDAEQIVW